MASLCMDEKVPRLRHDELVSLFELVAGARGKDYVTVDGDGVEWIYSALLELRELRGAYLSPKKRR